MERKHRKHYKFMFLKTILEGRIVMKDNWIFNAFADPSTATIVFTANWVLTGYSTVRAITFRHTYEDVPLETHYTRHEQTKFEGPSILLLDRCVDVKDSYMALQ